MVNLLPANLEQLAVETGALVRRRVVKSAADLLRLALLYAMPHHSLRTVAALDGFGMSDVAVLNRLRQMPAFLRAVLAQMMDCPAVESIDLQRPICVVDGSVLTTPKSTTSDWRLHATLDAITARPLDLTLTDGRVAEHLAIGQPPAGALLIGDRNYAKITQLQTATANGWVVLMRVSMQNLTMQTLDGEPLDPWELMRAADAEPSGIERAVQMPIRSGKGKGGVIRARLVVQALPEDAAENARQRVRRSAQRKGQQIRELTVALAGYVMLISTVDSAELSTAQLLNLYRVRWRIESYFKHLKSDLHLNEIRANDPALVSCLLLTRLLIACLVDRLRPADFSPSG